MQVTWEPSAGPVWSVRLRGDAAGNVALDPSGLAELERALDAAAGAPRCRVLVLSGTHSVFCRGMDLDSVAGGEGDHDPSVAAFARCLARLRRMGPAVICAVEGEAMGGGVGLAAAGDIVIAGPEATFTLPELRLGLLPAVVFPILRERLSVARLRWLALSGTRLDARRAHELGLVDERVPKGRSMARAIDSALRRVLRARPQGVARLDGLLRDMEGLALEEALEVGVAQTAADLRAPETGATLRGVAAGELPPWFERPPRGGR